MLTEPERKYMRRHMKKVRAAANSIRDGVIPTRGYTFDDGETFSGVAGASLRYRDLSNDELADNSANGRVIAPNSVADTHLIETADNSASVSGQAMKNQIMAPRHFPVRSLSNGNQNALPNGLWVDNANIANVGAAKILGDVSPENLPPLHQIKGKINAFNQIDYGNGTPIPAEKVAAGYRWDKINGRPKMGKYLTRADFKNDGTLKR